MKKCISSIQEFYNVNLPLIEKKTYIKSYYKKDPQYDRLDGKLDDEAKDPEAKKCEEKKHW